MYVNIGWEEFIRSQDIIGLFNKESCEFYVMKKARRIRYDKKVRTVILTDEGMYRVPIKTDTIAERTNRTYGGI
ncbi:MAG: hypothetical protein ACOCWO_02410 [Candidatus Muiribacteriaceae bacterium]